MAGDNTPEYTIKDDNSIFFHRSGHFYMLETTGRGKPSVALFTEGGALVHRDRVNLDDRRERDRFANAVTAFDTKGVVASELLTLSQVIREHGGDADGADGFLQTLSHRSQASELVDLAENQAFQLFVDQDIDVIFASFEHKGHLETWPLRSEVVRVRLSQAYYLRHKSAPGTQAVQNALETLAGKAIADGVTHPVFTRTAWLDGKVYLDLGDEHWRCVEVGRDGWRVRHDAPVRFRRSSSMRALPLPERGGDIRDLRRFLNLKTDEDFVLICAWETGSLLPHATYTILALLGIQGHAKSTTGEVLKRLIDPTRGPLRGLPRDTHALMIAATNNLILAYDNVSSIPTWLSDSFCNLATGGGFAVRKYYTDNEETVFEATRAVLLTGIEDFLVRPDLLDRSVLVYPPAISRTRRKTKADFWSDFTAAHPRLLGSLLDLVSLGLRSRDSVQIPYLHRMADYARWGAAIAGAFDLTPEAFLQAYAANRVEAALQSLASSPIAMPLFALLDDAAPAGEWSGTATALLGELAAYAGEALTKKRTWPDSGQALSNRLRRMAPNLATAGVHVRFGERTGHAGDRILTIRDGRTEAGAERAAGDDDDEDAAKHGDTDDGTRAQHTRRSLQNAVSSVSSVSKAGTDEVADAADTADTSPQTSSRSTVVADQPAPPPSPSASATPYVYVTEKAQLNAAMPRILAAAVVGFDLETTGLAVYTDRIRLAQFAIPDVTFVVDCDAIDMDALAPIFAGAKRLAGHNLPFDLSFIAAAQVPLSPEVQIFDSMLAVQLLDAGPKAAFAPSHSLQAVAARFLDLALDKAEQTSGWMGPLRQEQLAYAALDAAVHLELMPVLQAELARSGQERAAAIEFACVPATAWLIASGVPFNTAHWAGIRTAAACERDETEAALNAAVTEDLLQQVTQALSEQRPGKTRRPLTAINWNSTAQVQAVLNARQGGRRLANVSEATLQEIAQDEPLVSLILRRRAAVKRIGTYGTTYEQQVNPTTARIHARYRQIGAETGRMACTDPPMQTVPRAKDYRRAFGSQDDDTALVKLDFKTFELRIAAAYAKDQTLLAAFRADVDVHRLTAARALGIAEDAVTDEQRQNGKTTNFALLYGAQPDALVEQAGKEGRELTLAQAQQFHAGFFRLYRGIWRWHQRRPNLASDPTRTLTGRRRLGLVRRPTVPGKPSQIVTLRHTDRLNSPIQGTAVDVLKVAMARLWRGKDQFHALTFAIVVHDEVVLQCARSEAEAVARWAQAEMEAAGREVVAGVDLPVEYVIGRDWSGTPLTDSAAHD